LTTNHASILCRLVIVETGSGATEDTTQRVVTSVQFQCEHPPVSRVLYSTFSSCMVFVTRRPEHWNPKSRRFLMPSSTQSGSTIVSCTRVLDERKRANPGEKKRGRRSIWVVGLRKEGEGAGQRIDIKDERDSKVEINPADLSSHS